MKIEYHLTTNELIKANMLLSLYRAYKPLLIFLILFFMFLLITGSSLLGFLIGIPIWIGFGIIFTFIMNLIMIRRNKHNAGKRTLVINSKGYQYSGESFKRETTWSEKKKIWFTRPYIFLDTTSLYPIVVKRNQVTEDALDEIKQIFGK